MSDKEDKKEEENEYFTLVDKDYDTEEETLDAHYDILSYQLAVAHIPESYKMRMITQN